MNTLLTAGLFQESTDLTIASNEVVSTETHVDDLLAASEIEVEMNELTGAIASLEQSLIQLDAVGAAAERALEVGGLDRAGADVLSATTETILASIGIDGNMVSSIESFGGTSDKASATIASVEGIKEWATNLWKAIMDAFKKVWNKLKDWYLKIFSGAARLVKAATSMRDAASKATGSVDQKKLDVGSLYSKLVIKKGTTTFTATQAGLVSVFAGISVDGALPEVKKVSKAFTTGIEKLTITANGKGFKTTSAFTKAVNDELTSLGNIVGGAGMVVVKKGDKTGVQFMAGTLTRHSPALPGNRGLFVTTPLTPASNLNELLKIRLNFATVDTKFTAAEGSLDALEANAVEDLCEEVITMASMVVDFEKQYKKVDGYRADLDKAVVAFNKMVDSEDKLDTPAKGEARDITRIGKNILDLYDQPTQKAIAYILGFGSSTLSFGGKCLGNLK